MNISFFYAHRAGTNPADIQAEIREVTRMIGLLWKRKCGDLVAITVRSTTGKKVWEESFGQNAIDKTRNKAKDANQLWEEWATNVVKMSDATTSKPRFNLYVCPDERVGRATARIQECALAEGRPGL